MLDEPSPGLAPLLVEEMFRVIEEINGQGVMVLLVEQNTEHALQIANRGFVLESGKVVLPGAGRGGLSREAQSTSDAATSVENVPRRSS